MRISFTDEELRDLEELLENYDALGEWDIKTQQHFLKKIKNSRSRSKASKFKIRHIEAAKRKKQNKHDEEVMARILKKYRETTLGGA